MTTPATITPDCELYDGSIQLYRGFCEPIMAALPADSVDLIVTDPPYFKVKDLPWDHQWDDPAGFLSWIGVLCQQYHRLLRPNGSLYMYASEAMVGRVEAEVSKWFNVLNRIVWRK